MKRGSTQTLSQLGQQALGQYESYLRLVADVSPVTIRNYLSDLRLFAAWYEQTNSQGQEISQPFVPSSISTPTMTRYRSYLQSVLELKPASVNRHLVTLKCYFSWVVSTGSIHTNPATVVKLISFVESPPRHITDSEEGALVAAVTHNGSLRDKTKTSADAPYWSSCFRGLWAETRAYPLGKTQRHSSCVRQRQQVSGSPIKWYS